jgi:hypothetical protein
MATTLRFPPLLSFAKAQQKLVDYAMFGDHGEQPRPRTPQQAEDLARGLGYWSPSYIETLRDWTHPVAPFENLAGPTFRVRATGGRVGIVDRHTGEELGGLGEDGVISLDPPMTHFAHACLSRDRAVQECSITEFYSALAHGFAALESFFAVMADRWNRANPRRPLRDGGGVGLRRKFTDWIPLVTGSRYDETERDWRTLWELKNVRDKKALHPEPALAMSIRELAEGIDAFRDGLAGTLLHVCLHVRHGVAPATVLNAWHMPSVEIVGEPDEVVGG